MSDLDDDELRATRILNGVEKTADNLFKELGYLREERKYADVYLKTTKDLIRQFGFNKTNKSIMIDVHYITIEELKAINKKCEELGWKE